MNFWNNNLSLENKNRIKIANLIYTESKEGKKEKKNGIGLTFEEYNLIEKVFQTPFLNKELEYYFEIGGLEEVYYQMDTNNIYSCSLEDLLRCGILSREEYLIRRRHRV